MDSLYSLIDDSSRIRIVTHHNPDGDAVGSTMALKHFLTGCLGKDARVIFPSPVPDSLSFLTEGEDCLVFTGREEESERELDGCDLIICLDFNRFSRTNTMEAVLCGAKAKKILIDHHLNPARECFDCVISDIEVSSTCELLYRLLKQSPAVGGDASALPRATGEALMAGMTTDTNNFANSVFPGTLAMASELIAAGIDRDMIIGRLYNEYRINRIQLFSHMLSENLHVTSDGVAYMIITSELWERFDCVEGESEGLVNVPLSVGDVKLSILLREDDGYFRVSLRSKKGISAAALAAESFHGGGHEMASGGRLYFPDDIPDREHAAEYLEQVTARFMHKPDGQNSK